MALRPIKKVLKDYAHASRLFVGDQYRLVPKLGFLFHLFIDVNPAVKLAGGPNAKYEIGMMVKKADLPKFSVETKTVNAYNRSSIVQTKMKYETITITFNDDSADVVRNFWTSYFKHYYRDADYQLTQDPYTGKTQKYNGNQTVTDFGFTPNSAEPFLKSIRLYSLHQKKFSEYILVNPIIKSFRHGSHAQGESEPMTHEMIIEYETVLYGAGTTSAGTPSGFATLHYDKSTSGIKSQTGYQVDSGNNVTNSIIPSFNKNSAFGTNMYSNMLGLTEQRSFGLKNANFADLSGSISDSLKQFNPDINTFVPNLLNSNGMVTTPFGGINLKDSIVKLASGVNPLPTEYDLKQLLKTQVSTSLRSTISNYTRSFPRNSVAAALAGVASSKVIKIVNDELRNKPATNQHQMDVNAQKRTLTNQIASLKTQQATITKDASAADRQVRTATATLNALNSKLSTTQALPDSNPNKTALLAQIQRDINLQSDIKTKAVTVSASKNTELTTVNQTILSTQAQKDTIK